MLKTSFTARLLKNLLLKIDMAESDEIGISGINDYDNKIIERLSLTPKNLYGTINYLTPNAKVVFT